MKAIKFKNFSDELFAHPSTTWKNPKTNYEERGTDDLCKYDNRPYCFPPGSEMYMDEDKALTFAKHLANRELFKISEKNIVAENERDRRDRQGLVSQMSPDMDDIDSFPKFKEFFYQAFIIEEEMVEQPKDAVSAEKRFCEFCDSKGHFHKKGCPVLEQIKQQKLQTNEAT